MATRELTTQEFGLAEREVAPRRWRAEHWLVAGILAMAAVLALSFAWPMLTQAMVSTPAQPAAQAANTVRKTCAKRSGMSGRMRACFRGQLRITFPWALEWWKTKG